MRRLSAGAISLVIGLAGLVGTGSAAQAAGPGASAGTVSITSSGRSTNGASAQQVITCTISVDNPHHSSHEPTTIRVFGRISCTAPVSALWSTITLVRDGAVVGSRATSNTASAALANAVVVPCVNGAYAGVNEGFVLFPPGFVPQGGFISAVTNPVVITTCP